MIHSRFFLSKTNFSPWHIISLLSVNLCFRTLIELIHIIFLGRDADNTYIYYLWESIISYETDSYILLIKGMSTNVASLVLYFPLILRCFSSAIHDIGSYFPFHLNHMPLIYVLCCVCKFCMVCLHVDFLD